MYDVFLSSLIIYFPPDKLMWISVIWTLRSCVPTHTVLCGKMLEECPVFRPDYFYPFFLDVLNVFFQNQIHYCARWTGRQLEPFPPLPLHCGDNKICPINATSRLIKRKLSVKTECFLSKKTELWINNLLPSVIKQHFFLETDNLHSWCCVCIFNKKNLMIQWLNKGHMFHIILKMF